MIEKANILGSAVANAIFISSILVFTARMILGVKPGHWIGIPILLMVFPLGYLLATAPSFQRPVLYYIQVGLMILWLVALFVVDYWPRFEFRQTRWMVISFVMLYFAGMGGMLGVASLAGRRWMISGVILFLVCAVLAFVQRAVTGY